MGNFHLGSFEANQEEFAPRSRHQISRCQVPLYKDNEKPYILRSVRKEYGFSLVQFGV